MWTAVWQSCRLQSTLVVLSPRQTGPKKHSGWCAHIAGPALLAEKPKRRNHVSIVLSLLAMVPRHLLCSAVEDCRQLGDETLLAW